MKTIDLNKIAPHLIAIVLFIALTLMYFMPFTKGYVLKQGDITNFRGMAQEIMEHRNLEHSEPLWTASMFSGMPAYQISVLYKNKNVLSYVDKLMRGGGFGSIFYVFLYMLGFYIFLLCLKTDPWLALLGGLAFGLSSYFIIILEAGHNSKAHAIGYMAPTLGAIILAYRGKVLLGASLTALFFGLELMCNHYQITYYLLMIVLFYGVAELVQQMKKGTPAHFLKVTGILVVAMGLGTGANISQIWNTMAYSKDSTRGKSELTLNAAGQVSQESQTSGLSFDYITGWSYGTGETLSLLIPGTKGGGSGAMGKAYPEAIKEALPQMQQSIGSGMNSYWGNQPFTSGPVYIGAIVMFLCLLGMIYSRNYLKWPLLAVALLAVALAWGKNAPELTRFFIDWVPGYDKFRTVSMILVIVELVVPAIGIFFLVDLIKYRKEIAQKMSGFYIAAGGTGLFLLLLYTSPGTFLNFTSVKEAGQFAEIIQSAAPQEAANYQLLLNETIKVRENVFKSDVLRTFGFIFFAAGLIFAFLRFSSMPKAALITGLALLITGDLWTVDKRFLNEEKVNGRYVNWQKKEKTNVPYTASPADKLILDMEAQRNPDLKNEIGAAIDLAAKTKLNSSARVKALSDDEKDQAAFSALRRTNNSRVLDVTTSTFNSSRASFFHKSIGGYHGAKLKRYQELADWYLYKEIATAKQVLGQQSNPSQWSGLFYQTPVLNMLNMRYVIFDPNTRPAVNPYAMGDAWFVKSATLVANADDEIQGLKEADLRKTALVDKRFEGQLGAVQHDPEGSIVLTDYKTDHLTYQSTGKDHQMAIFSEIYYDEWQAYIDGKPVDHFRANYVLRGLMIPPGNHKVEFVMESSTYVIGGLISLSSSLLIVLANLVVMGMYFRRKTNEGHGLPAV